MTPDVSSWRLVGHTANSKYYEVEEGTLAAVPNAGARDDGVTARENAALQNAYFKRIGHPGVVIVFFDRMVSQDRTARGVYQAEIDPTLTLGACLVGGTMLSRAMASFSLGFGKVRVPVKLFANLEEALVWARELDGVAKENRP